MILLFHYFYSYYYCCYYCCYSFSSSFSFIPFVKLNLDSTFVGYQMWKSSPSQMNSKHDVYWNVSCWSDLLGTSFRSSSGNAKVVPSWRVLSYFLDRRVSLEGWSSRKAQIQWKAQELECEVITSTMRTVGWGCALHIPLDVDALALPCVYILSYNYKLNKFVINLSLIFRIKTYFSFKFFSLVSKKKKIMKKKKIQNIIMKYSNNKKISLYLIYSIQKST